MTAAEQRAPGRRAPRPGRVQLEARVRQGWSRVVAAWFPIVQSAVAGGLAFVFAHQVVGHPYPFFAPVAAWISLGFSTDRSVRKVAELAVGVALGVALGDVIGHVIGSGAWQVAAALVVAALVARFLDRGQMFTMQSGVQAMIIVGLPASAVSGGPFGRWLDALIGGVVALAVAVLTPSDPRRHPRALARTAVEELAGVLHVLATGLTDRSEQDVEHALVRGRSSQPPLNDWSETTSHAVELARVSPSGRRYRDDLVALARAATRIDRAMRNARVLARRALAVVASPAPHELSGLGRQVEETALAVDELAAALGAGREPGRARERLQAVAATLDPFALVPDDWQAQSLVLLQRSLVVDLLEAAGLSPAAARERLPEI